MTVPRYSISRRKACDQCCKAKTRCTPGSRSCKRCSQRGEICTYADNASSKAGVISLGRTKGCEGGSPLVKLNEPLPPQHPVWTAHMDSNINNVSSKASTPSNKDLKSQPELCFPSSGGAPTSTSKDADRALLGNGEEHFLFDCVEDELMCPINAEDIQNRWLSAYMPSPDQTIKEYPKNVVSFMSRMLKSYAVSVINDRGLPPFVHFSQITTSTVSLPLKTCLTMVRLLAKSFPGSQDVAVSTIRQEMRKLYPFNVTCGIMTLLTKFQAYLIYTMALYFSVEDLPRSFLRESMMAIQDLACASSHQGLMCVAEKQFSRPRWEAWIICEVKRRTLYIMCMFDSILLSREGLPNYLSIELKGLTAPSSKHLWQSRSRRDWEISYNVHLAEWPEEFLRIDELWPTPLELSQDDVRERGHRVDRWLEAVDEYGTMLFAVTSCTHGS